ncbi:MAG TPA: nucleotidyltransferase domain-containing protein [Candidatus Eremiobacteraeota bacterium]|nr:MAG: putative nucleotidyltransferase [bacterium ADurb.Bin363]HPZ07420.1 nucleotidyltransferase domain-containing protein [Candidatus Eremiobacteraeota bacterium]
MTVPPMEFENLCLLIPEGNLKDEIRDLLKRKKSSKEFNLESKIKIINEYMEKEIDHAEDYLKTLNRLQTDEIIYDKIFREVLKEVWW